MGGLDHPHQSERMTDGGFCPGRTRPWKEKKGFLEDNGGVRRAKVVTPSHHKDRGTVHGRVETQDTKGSTWISKDVG